MKTELFSKTNLLKCVFMVNPFPKTFKSFRKMAWKKPFFKRVSSKISARMLNLMTLPLGGEGYGEGGLLEASWLHATDAE
jgi:hypothetical protein